MLMQEKCKTLREKYKNNTLYNQKVKARLMKMENNFPGKTWFLSIKPLQTKVNYEHTTGLCKDCHSSQVNHDTLLKQARVICQCGSDQCENWICLCEEEDCTCEP